jgi:hypothetical protein
MIEVNGHVVHARTVGLGRGAADRVNDGVNGIPT